jgi:Ni,Fe-hydrogenase III large subunit/NADH:ubiquinone oxidoreductase subunit C
MTWHRLRHLEAVERSHVPVLEIEPWIAALREKLAAGAYPVTVFGEDEGESRVRVWCVLGDIAQNTLWLTSTRIEKVDARFASLANDFPAMNYFECELFEQTGIRPEHHPWLRPVRLADDWRQNGKPYEFYAVEGEEVHEVAVGPVHAGVIEPGHFRFQCYGEQILHLEIMLGYQRRGVETLLPKRNAGQQIVLVESIAGDSVIGHATAFCSGIECLAGSTLSLRDHAVRSIAAELERIAMHLSTLSGISTDIGFALPAAAIGNLRTLTINLTAEICGSRFGRGWIIPGGVRFDPDGAWVEKAKKILATIREKFRDAESLLFDSASALARLEDTGAVTKEAARQIGLVGLAARASGINRDVRIDFPYGMYRYAAISSTVLESGDVYARAKMRSLEIERSIGFILEQLENLPAPKSKDRQETLRPDAIVVSLAEGHRGEIAHVLLTDASGKLSRVKIKDPSFHNWQGLSIAVRENGISDFPLCNKSFDLSYAGHDL